MTWAATREGTWRGDDCDPETDPWCEETTLTGDAVVARYRFDSRPRLRIMELSIGQYAAVAYAVTNGGDVRVSNDGELVMPEYRVKRLEPERRGPAPSDPRRWWADEVDYRRGYEEHRKRLELLEAERQARQEELDRTVQAQERLELLIASRWGVTAETDRRRFRVLVAGLAWIAVAVASVLSTEAALLLAVGGAVGVAAMYWFSVRGANGHG